jgi:serine/threonine-protein kinase RsbW
MTDPHELKVTIGSRFDELELVDLLMGAATGWTGLSEEDAGGVALAVREAAANAVRHGNRMDDGKRVDVRARFRSNELEIVVCDEGEGFDPSALPDPLAPSNLLKPTGRGIFLMRRLMDQVEFDFPEQGGTIVTMTKTCPPAAE